MNDARWCLLLVCLAGCGTSSNREAAKAHGIRLAHNEPIANARDRELKPGWCYCDNGTSRCKDDDGSMTVLAGICGGPK